MKLLLPLLLIGTHYHLISALVVTDVPPSPSLPDIALYGGNYRGEPGAPTAPTRRGTTPEPTRPPIAGPYGQDCTPASGDFPQMCQQPGQIAQQNNAGQIVCTHNHDCCLCGQMICRNCKSVTCNGDSSCYGVKHIEIMGEQGVMGGNLNCNGDVSCMDTVVYGANVGRLLCTGDWSCALARMDVVCVDSGCTLSCLGDDSCKGHPTDPTRRAMFRVTNSMGMACAHDSCRDATYHLMNNKGGIIGCGSEAACVDATITVDNIESISCGGQFGCYNSNILVTNPQNGFTVECAGFAGCSKMNLEIMITDPSITSFRGISCSSAAACKDMTVTIQKQHSKTVTIEELHCGQAESCRHALFDFAPGINLKTCGCAGGLSMACDNIRGVPACESGLNKFECVGANGCEGLVETITNPAQDFEIICGDPNSCNSMKLTINIDGSQPNLSRFKGITCGTQYACTNMEVTIVNTGANLFDAGTVICTSPSACKNVKLTTYNADFKKIDCGGSSTSCRNCEYQKDGRCSKCEDPSAACPNLPRINPIQPINNNNWW